MSTTSSIPRLVRKFRTRELSKVLPSPNLANDSRQVRVQNPFLPFFNPVTKRWAPPLYSRRRQQELVKAAKASGILYLLPAGPKLRPSELQNAIAQRQSTVSSNEQEAPTASSSKTVLTDDGLPTQLNTKDRHEGLYDVEVDWMGEVKVKDVAGADVGARLYAGKKRMFKGHKWERTLRKRTGQIKVRMRDMRRRIARFKNKYRRRRPSPLAAPKPRKKESLPF